MAVSIFPDTSAQSVQQRSLLWSEFVQRIRSPKEYDRKGAMPLVKLARFGDARTDRASLRHDANVLAIDGIEGDYDAGELSIGDAATMLADAGIVAVLYSSPNHDPARPRWRVLCPLSRERSPDGRRMLVGRLNRVLGGVLAPESFALSQSYYIGRTRLRDNGTPAVYAAQEIRGHRCIDEADEIEPLYSLNGHATESAASEARDDPVLNILRERGVLLRTIKPGTHAIRCPWEAEHTKDTGDSATAYLQANFDGRRLAGFKCQHGHCAGRSLGDLMKHLDISAGATGDDFSDDQAASENATAADSWPVPKPLPDLPPVQPFDWELLPAKLRGWGRDVADLMQCPPDFVAVPMMVALGSLIGRKVGVRPKERDNWTEFPNQWGLLIGRPGTMKSPAIACALAPLRRLESKAAEVYEADREVHAVAEQVAKLRAEAAKKEAQRALAADRNADVARLLRSEDPAAPMLRRYSTNDSSYEKLGDLLIENPNGLLVLRDEMYSLLKHLDREDNASVRGFFLTGWGANQPYTFDRIGRGANLRVPAVTLSLLGGIQPARIAEFLRAAVNGGSGDDGLVQRFGLMVWPNDPGDWRDVDREPNTDAKRDAAALFEHVDRAIGTDFGAPQDAPDEPAYLRLDSTALGLFRDWRTSLERDIRSGNLHPAIESHLAKYRKLVPSLALVCHLGSGQVGPIGEIAMLQALSWAEYLRSHADRVYASIATPAAGIAKAILAKLRQGEVPAEFRARDVYRAGWAGLTETDRVREGLRLLVDFDWIATEQLQTAGRWATVYRVNPRALQ